MVICKCAKWLDWGTNYVTTTSRSLIISIDCGLIRLKLMLVDNLVIFKISFIFLLAILLTVVSIALMLNCQFVEVLSLTIQCCYTLIDRSCWRWADWWVGSISWYQITAATSLNLSLLLNKTNSNAVDLVWNLDSLHLLTMRLWLVYHDCSRHFLLIVDTTLCWFNLPLRMGALLLLSI